MVMPANGGAGLDLAFHNRLMNILSCAHVPFTLKSTTPLIKQKFKFINFPNRLYCLLALLPGHMRGEGLFSLRALFPLSLACPAF